MSSLIYLIFLRENIVNLSQQGPRAVKFDGRSIFSFAQNKSGHKTRNKKAGWRINTGLLMYICYLYDRPLPIWHLSFTLAWSYYNIYSYGALFWHRIRLNMISINNFDHQRYCTVQKLEECFKTKTFRYNVDILLNNKTHCLSISPRFTSKFLKHQLCLLKEECQSREWRRVSYATILAQFPSEPNRLLFVKDDE